jgi:CheY-like chemotaxis protein
VLTIAGEISGGQACVRVLVVDDRSVFRDVICRLVDAAQGLDLLAAAESGETAVAAVTELEPDMVIMDVAMPGIGGIAASRRIKADRPATVVVLVSATHPADLPPEIDESLADVIVWKPHLRPALLEQIWVTHRSPRGGGISSS